MRNAEAALVLVVALCAACVHPAQLPPGEAPSCDADTFRLVGTLEGKAIDVTQPADTGGFSQSGGGDFASVNKTRQIDASKLSDVRLTWAGAVVTGESGPAVGTFTVPATFPGATFCADDGTAVRIVPAGEGGGLQFRLQSLSSGANCGAPRTGSLHGCWRPAPVIR